MLSKVLWGGAEFNEPEPTTVSPNADDRHAEELRP